MTVLDSSSVLAYVEGEAGGDRVVEALATGSAPAEPRTGPKSPTGFTPAADDGISHPPCSSASA